MVSYCQFSGIRPMLTWCDRSKLLEQPFSWYLCVYFFTNRKSKGFASKKSTKHGREIWESPWDLIPCQFPACQVRTLEKFTITSGVCTVCHLQEGPLLGPQVLTPNKNHDVNLFPPKNIPKHGVFVNGGTLQNGWFRREHPIKWI